MSISSDYDKIVDTVVNRSETLKKRLLTYVEKNYKKEKLHHYIYMIEMLSDRLSLAEYALYKDWDFSLYRESAKELGFWF